MFSIINLFAGSGIHVCTNDARLRNVRQCHRLQALRDLLKTWRSVKGEFIMDQLVRDFRTGPLGGKVVPGDGCSSVSCSIRVRGAINVCTSQVVVVELLILQHLSAYNRRLLANL